jgi:fructose-1,6-bisphosphatase I
MAIPTQTLSRFIFAEGRRFPNSTGELNDLIVSISLGVKLISQMVATAGFKGLHGYTGAKNVHGDEVKQLDVEADEVLVELLSSSHHFGLLVSEERDSVVQTDASLSEGKYVIAFDPLDGSSNIGSNIPTGTIFCIFRRLSENALASEADFCQPGSAIVAAGYSIYGAKTSFVYSAGNGVHGFTLDPTIGEFILTEPTITIPSDGSIYSINEANSPWWSEGTKNYIERLKAENLTRKPPLTARYVGSLVADFDRTLRKGGIFLYPIDARRPQGRLRLLYECLPLAFIAEQAGGAATNGKVPIVSVTPKDIHERSAFIMGGEQEVAQYLKIAGTVL